MVTDQAGIVETFVGLVVERHGFGAHSPFRGQGRLDAGLDEHRVRLVALHARDDFESFNQLLLGGIMTAAAGNRPGIIEFGQGFAMTINAGKMRRQAQ